MRWTAFVVLSLLLVTSAAAQHNFAAVDEAIDAAIAAEQIPGAVVLIAQDGEVLHERAFGDAQRFSYGNVLLEPPEAMTPAHVFDVASLTKVMATTFALMLLVEDGVLDLDMPVHRALPTFRGTAKDSITVRHLLSHTSGLMPWEPMYYHASSPSEALTHIATLPLVGAVGERVRYSDLGFMLLGYLVEAVSGQPLNAFLRDRLYLPLDLSHTGFRPLHGPFAATSHGNPFERRMVTDDSFGYVCDEDPTAFTDWRTYTLVGEVNDGNAHHAHQGVAGHAGLFSTAEELNRLMTLLLNDGAYDGREYLSPATLRAFLGPHTATRALGWAVDEGVLGMDDLPDGAFGHTGFTGTLAVGIPSRGLSILLLTNRQNLGVGDDGRYASLTDLRRAVVRAALDATR
ncbi:MAG: serine hydrolase domain-containing protein [Rhodothermales bacterium]